MSHVFDGDAVGAFSGAQWLLFELGAHRCKLGIDADERPRALLPPHIYVRPNSGDVDWDDTRVWIGEPPSEGAYADFALLDTGAPPLAHEWERGSRSAAPPPLPVALEQVFLHAVMNELREDPASSPLLLTDSPRWSEAQRRQLADVLLHKIGFAGVGFVSAQVALALSAGTANGLVVDLGESGVRVALVLAARVRADHVVHSSSGGLRLKARLRAALGAAAASVSDASLDAMLRELAVSPSPLEALSSLSAVSVGGVTLSAAQRSAVVEELLFSDSDADALPALLAALVSRLSDEERSLALNNVVVGGGLANIPGVRARVKYTLSQSAQHFATLLQCDALHGAFSGLAVLASMDIALLTADNADARQSTHVRYAPGLFLD